MIKNLKINKDKMKLYTSYVLIATTTAIGMKVSGIGLPFHIDKTKQQVYEEKIVSSDNSIKTNPTTQKHHNLLYYYGKWQTNSEKSKQRIYKIYKLNSKNEEELTNDIEMIKRNLIAPAVEGIEYKQLISDEEIQENEYWQAFIYNKIEDNYIIVKETDLHNFISSLIYILTTTGLCSTQYFNYKDKTLEKKKV